MRNDKDQDNGFSIQDDIKSVLPWLKNGIWALSLAGLYSIILVVLRTPQLSNLFTDKSLFKSALIIHVDLSVLVWMLSIMCVIWSCKSHKNYGQTIFSKLAWIGMGLMAISPLVAQSKPVMNNYIPMLENIWFIIGLSLFGSVVLCFAVIVILSAVNHLRQKKGNTNIILALVKLTTAFMYIMIWGCFALSYYDIIVLINIFPIDIDYYYELLFWSGGHLLQFLYTQLVMYVWLVLAQFWVKRSLTYYTIYAWLFISNFILSSLVFYGHYAYDMSEYEFTAFFTRHMQYTGGIVPTLFVLVLSVDLFKYLFTSSQLEAEFIKDRNGNNSFIPMALIFSAFMFFIGGLIGILISGINVSISAHYHGSIVGISIAFLGLAYVFCFQGMGFHITKWPKIQLYLITGGQLLHITGLALAGGYGVMRKNPDEAVAPLAKIYMGMVGGGGLVAIIGGLMFVYICGKRIYHFGN